MKRKVGEYVTQTVASESYRTHLPAPLPPDPPLALDTDMLRRMDEANRALERRQGLARGDPEA